MDAEGYRWTEEAADGWTRLQMNRVGYRWAQGGYREATDERGRLRTSHRVGSLASRFSSEFEGTRGTYAATLFSFLL